MIDGKVVLLTGGVGGAKLARGMAAALRPEQLTMIVNTGDDFTHLGLRISPDIDTLLYSLAGLSDEDDLYAAGLTSHGSVNLMLALEERFDIEFPEHLLRRRTFESIAAIRAAVAGLRDGTAGP